MTPLVLGLELNDYLTILRRRKWVILLCLCVGLLGAAIVYKVTPKIYKSSTLVLVESQKIPENYVRGVIAGSIQERLTMIQQIVMSRSLLSRIIEEFHLYGDILEQDGKESAIEAMRKNITVNTVGQGARVEAFSLSFMNPNPTIAMKVTSRLGSQFIEENIKQREQMVEGASQFLQQELDNAKTALDKEERLISEFKAKHMGELPSQSEANLRTLDRYQNEKNAVEDELRKLADRVGTLDKTVKEYDYLGTAIDDSSRRDMVGPKAASVGPEGSIRDLERRLTTLSAEYTDEYPDIKLLKQQIAKIKEQSRETGSGPETENPKVAPKQTAAKKGDHYLQALVEQREQVKIEIAGFKARRAALAKLVDQYEKRVEATPATEQQLTMLVRDYDNMQRNYQSILEKKVSARVAENLEKRQKGEQFRVIDPANLPTKPVKPDPLFIFFGGLGAGFGLAGLSLWWLDFRNMTFRRPEEVELYLKLPVLAKIPHMYGLPARQTRNSATLLYPVQGRPVLGNGKVQKSGAKFLATIKGNRAFTKEDLMIQEQMSAAAFEELKVLAGRMVEMAEKKGMKVFALTSSLAAEGKTTIARALAMSLAKDYFEPTIVIDGDVRTGALSKMMKRSLDKGLTDLLAGDCTLDEVLYVHPELENLRILPTGMRAPDMEIAKPAKPGRPTITGSRARLRNMFADLKRRGAFVIVDTPPILLSVDTIVLSHFVDGMMLVIKADETLQSTVSQAAKCGGTNNFIGIVLNDLSPSLHPLYYQHYYRPVSGETKHLLQQVGSKDE